MLIKKIRLKDFKKFRSLEKEFSPGINVVKGPHNETGKSTLLEGILVTLFENPKSSASKLNHLWTWGATNKGHLQIEFQADGKDYVLDKDFDRKTLCLTAQDSSTCWDVPNRVEEKLRHLLGTTSDKLYRSTCCIKQDDLRAVQSGREEVSQNMERIITGGTHGTTATEAIKRLSDAISVFKRGLDRLAKSPGIIASLQKEISEKEKELADAFGKIEEAEKLRQELLTVAENLDKETKEYDTCQQLLDKNEERQKIENNIAGLTREYDACERLCSEIEKLEREKEEASRELDTLQGQGFDDESKVAGVKQDLTKLDTERQIITRDLPKRKAELTEAERELRKKSLLTALASTVTMVIGACLAVAGFSLIFWQRAAAIAVGLLGAILLIISSLARSQTTALKTRKADLQNRISKMEAELKNIQGRETDILSLVKCSTREEFDQKLSRYEELVKKRRDREETQKLLLQGRSYEELKTQRIEIARKLRVEEDRLTDNLKNTRLSPEEWLTCQKRVEELKRSKEEKERRKLQIEVQLEQSACDPEDISRLEEELQELRMRLQAEERKLRACELARDFIERARRETLESVHEELQQKIQGYFSIFTDGKYKSVQLKPGTLECDIFSGEKGDWVKPKELTEELSGGTIDQFYLAYRLALAQIIYRDRQPPLIFDDPFYNFDSIRLSRALALLKEVSKQQQVIIFTLGDTYDTIADRVIELPPD